jgi:hypothetical protein
MARLDHAEMTRPAVARKLARFAERRSEEDRTGHGQGRINCQLTKILVEGPQNTIFTRGPRQDATIICAGRIGQNPDDITPIGPKSNESDAREILIREETHSRGYNFPVSLTTYHPSLTSSASRAAILSRSTCSIKVSIVSNFASGRRRSMRRTRRIWP